MIRPGDEAAERRRTSRVLCTEALQLRVLDAAGHPLPITAISFSRYGLSVFSSLPLEPGSHLQLRLSYHSAALEQEEVGFSSRVVHCSGSEAGFQAGLEFDPLAVDRASALFAVLVAIEQDLRHSLDAEDRYQTGLSEYD